MRGGSLRHRVTITRPVETQTDTGDYATTWQTVATPYARVEGLAGRESMIGHTLQGVAIYRITIRHRDGIRVDDQVTLTSGVTLNITSATDLDGSGRELTIMAETGTERDE